VTMIEPERTLQSETVFAGKLIQVRRDSVRLPSGKETTREIVEHPEVVGILPVLDDGRIVFVRQYRKAVNRILLEVPAGGIEPDESPEEAVRRELQEETGYQVGTMERLAAFYTSPGFTTELMYLYRAGGLVAGTPTEETDQIEVLLLTLEEARRRMQEGEMADAKTLLALSYVR
jgi:ADP-ribose pyrophosphatase